MFSWFRNRRRRKILARAFPETWEAILAENARFASELDLEQQSKLRGAIQVLVAEKNWEGCGGLQLRDEHRVTIAAQIARMTLHFEHEYFEAVQSILVYPTAYLARSIADMGSGVVVEGQSGRAGEAWYRGPVILSWADVLSTGRGQRGAHNVVVHEFAHQFDMRNGPFADGIPVIESPALAQRWNAVMSAACEELGEMCRRGMPSIIDCYGATDRAEFFAVASEAYFEQPQALHHQWPEVFDLLEQFYSPPP
ncbi:MAG: zinc-dependent peptidase [Planctomycetales bacterium]|nr:zinc-dependent peptidase [Planctomycetales bacterium]